MAARRQRAVGQDGDLAAARVEDGQAAVGGRRQVEGDLGAGVERVGRAAQQAWVRGVARAGWASGSTVTVTVGCRSGIQDRST